MFACLTRRNLHIIPIFSLCLFVILLLGLESDQIGKSSVTTTVQRQLLKWHVPFSMAKPFALLQPVTETTDLEESLDTAWEEPASFIGWLQSHDVHPDRIPFVTIGDEKYLQTLQNMRERLDQWGYGRDLVVLCLDEKCARALNFGFGGYINQTIAELKFAVNIELAQHGYNFIFLDADVYFTGSIDPFEEMLPLSDKSWDIQFQPDASEPSTSLNIGWYFTRSNNATVSYFQRSRDLWEASDRTRWDQEVMNAIGATMELEEQSLKIYHLHGMRFQNFMLTDWEETLFGDGGTIEQYINKAAVIHFTGLEQPLKEYCGRNFGGFTGTSIYYSKPPPLLAMVNASGQSDSIHYQVTFAAQVANVTGRTLVWPDAVDMVQRQLQSGEHNLYWHKPNFPGIRAVSYADAYKAGVPVVEGRYLANQDRNNPHHGLRQVLIDVADHLLNAQRGVYSLEKYVGKLKPSQVAVLDFAAYGPKLLRPADRNLHDLQSIVNISAHLEAAQYAWYHDVFVASGAEDYIASDMFDKIRKCNRADTVRATFDVCLT